MIRRIIGYVEQMQGGWKFWGLYAIIFTVMFFFSLAAVAREGGPENWGWLVSSSLFVVLSGFITGVKLGHRGRPDA